MLQPHDFIMVDRGFKIKNDLAMYQYQLCIPPSAAKGNQMTANAVKETSNVENCKQAEQIQAELSLTQLFCAKDL